MDQSVTVRGQRGRSAMRTDACDVMYDAVDDIALERLKHNGTISRDKHCLAVPGTTMPLPMSDIETRR